MFDTLLAAEWAGCSLRLKLSAKLQCCSRAQPRAARASSSADLAAAYAAAAFSGLFFRMAKSRSSTCGAENQKITNICTGILA